MRLLIVYIYLDYVMKDTRFCHITEIRSSGFIRYLSEREGKHTNDTCGLFTSLERAETTSMEKRVKGVFGKNKTLFETWNVLIYYEILKYMLIRIYTEAKTMKKRYSLCQIYDPPLFEMNLQNVDQRTGGSG